MMIVFHIEYYARRDERLFVVFDDGTEYAMRRESEGLWSAEVPRDADDAAYRYELRAADGPLLRGEWGAEHRLGAGSAKRTEVFDHWYERPAAAPFYSSFFTRGVFRRPNPRKAAEAVGGRILLRVEAPTVTSDEAVAVVGEHEASGGWQVERAVAMNDGAAPVWSVSLPASVAGSEFKFMVTDAATGRFKRYEGGFNRRFPATSDNGSAIVVDGLRMRDESPLWRGAGVAVPLFSLRSGRGWGCGEFRDLRLLADWAAAAGLSVIQLLPVNDTSAMGTWRDSYPYNALSCFALHPMYVSAEAVVKRCSGCTRSAELAAAFDEFAAEGARLNALSAVDYEAVMKLKTAFLRRAYDLCGDDTMSSDEYAAFERKNAEWLSPYAVFCALRDEYATADHTQWGTMARYDAARAELYARENAHAVGFHKFVQYLLDRELREAGDYARGRGVLLKGDIPIGVSPSSVEVWRSPELFNLSMSAGAPPDDFAAKGQNWGFPTYNWLRMAEDGYAWWRSRLRKMAEYFDAYRIDHILGFFRIWEVPRGAASALEGHFNPSLPYDAEEIRAFGFPFDAALHAALFTEYPYSRQRYFPRIDGCKTAAFAALDDEARRSYAQLYEDFYYRRHNDFWRDCALKRLPKLISATGMLACGEDLGMIPACVPDVMRSEQILSLEIERMPKRFGEEFGDPAEYPYLSVAATSTHDMSTVRGWWRENREATRRYWHDILGHEGEPPVECSGESAREIAERHMRSRSMLAILPLQDWLAIDENLRGADPDAERINVPADPDHYWRYRMHISLEELLTADGFNDAVRALTALRRGK